jgi:hypothetical protein
MFRRSSTRAETHDASACLRDAIANLTEANRQQSDGEIERALVRLRQLAWERETHGAGAVPSVEPVCDPFGDCTRVPEVDARDLDAATIRAALERHGALVVRGLFSPERCARLREGIEASWGAIDRYRESRQFDSAWFDPLRAGGFGRDMVARAWGFENNTAYVADSPRLFFAVLEALDDVGAKRLVTDYFGETPVLSLAKTAQRRFPPDAAGGWHQDAAVYGTDAHALDFWIPVSRCGDVAPGLSVWPRRLDHVVETVGDSTTGFGTHPDALAALTAEVAPVSPVFSPGDAMIIDEMTLHSTHSDPLFTETRYGLEVWFFAPSTFPDPELRVPIVY